MARPGTPGVDTTHASSPHHRCQTHRYESAPIYRLLGRVLLKCSWTDGKMTTEVQETEECFRLAATSEASGEIPLEELISLIKELENLETVLSAYGVFIQNCQDFLQVSIGQSPGSTGAVHSPHMQAGRQAGYLTQDRLW